jgi:hypothetical protein
VGRHRGDIPAVDQDVTSRGRVETADDIEQGRLARTGAADQGNELTSFDRERHVAQGLDLDVAATEGA